ncbi:MAG TPA: helix-turn-helix domain-containing protein [Longimicrobiales bacterium]|nr:helix-turn-helix domain-containing protein [Longimicrobiales bacterium]
MADTARGASPSSPASAALEVVRSPERAATLLDPVHRRLIEALREAPDSAAGLARRFGEKRQTVNYHLRALEDARLVELSEERRRGNCTERVMRVVAREYVLDSAALGTLGAPGRPTGDRFSATYLIAVAARAIRELADLVERAGRQKARLATATVETEVRLATPRDFGRFTEDLAEAVGRVVARHDAGEGGRPLRVIAAAYPAAAGAADVDRAEGEPTRRARGEARRAQSGGTHE